MHSSARVAAVIAALALMAAVAVWLFLTDGGGAAGQPQSAGAVPSEAPAERSLGSEPPSTSKRPSEAVSEPQSTTPEETRAERLARLRKTDAFVEFANWDRARIAPNYERALGDFAWYDPNRNGRVGFVNSKVLWNQIVGPIRDDLIAAGTDYRGRFLDGDVRGGVVSVIERSRSPHQELDFISAFSSRQGKLRVRVNAVLITVPASQENPNYGRGRLVARMEPFTIDPSRYQTTAELGSEGIGPRVDRWAAQE
ncbi:hypothetical protein BH24ACT14_BH24ACT14_09080 [soil metagenome]